MKYGSVKILARPKGVSPGVACLPRGVDLSRVVAIVGRVHHQVAARLQDDEGFELAARVIIEKGSTASLIRKDHLPDGTDVWWLLPPGPPPRRRLACNKVRDRATVTHVERRVDLFIEVKRRRIEPRNRKDEREGDEGFLAAAELGERDCLGSRGTRDTRRDASVAHAVAIWHRTHRKKWPCSHADGSLT